MDRAPPVKTEYLRPCEYFVGDAGYQVRTLLGSCVAFTVWHPRRRIGAISHFMLPRGSSGGLDPCYGDDAMRLILRELGRLQVAVHECQGKIFGGANMFPDQVVREALDIGRKNGETARALLYAHRIPVIAENLFGSSHRVIVFNISNGDVWESRHVVSAVAQAPQWRERE